MSKKLSFGKLAGIIFCILAAAGTIVLLWANAYFSGQMKTIDKYLTAIERNDFESYKDCFYLPEKVCTEANLTAEKNASVFAKSFSLSAESSVYSQIASYTIDNDKFKARADFKKRVKIMDGRYVVIFDLTLYNETESVKLENISRPLGRAGGKWKIFSLSGSQNLQTITELNENGSAETGGDVLSIVYNGTFSAGDRAVYSLSEENVIAEDNTAGIAANRETTHDGIIISKGTADFDYYYSGWDFIPVNAGNCTITVLIFAGGYNSYTDTYNVTVDENMKITYTLERENHLQFTTDKY